MMKPQISMKIAIPQWPAAAEVQHRRNPHDGRAARRQQREDAGEHAEHHRRRHARDREADADQDALEDRRQADAVEHAARDARQVIEELLAMILRHRDQPLQAVEHAACRRAGRRTAGTA